MTEKYKDLIDKTEFPQIICCGKEMEWDHSFSISGKTSWKLSKCKECGKFSKVYANKEIMEKEEKNFGEEALVNFYKSELSKRGYHWIKDKDYTHHGEITLRALQDDLSSQEMRILGEIKGDRAIIYLQPICCCDLAINEVEREPIKLPLLSLPANTKDIKYFDYFPFSWKHPTWGQTEENEKEGTLKSIWENRDKPTLLGTSFPRAKTEIIEQVKNKGFLWEGGEEKDNYLKAICPRCEWIYNCKLTEKYLKVEEQGEMVKAIKNHEC